MRFLSLNPWGLENPQGFHTLCNLLVKEKPDLVFLQEIMVRASFFSLKKFKLHFHNAIVVDCEKKSGGFTILWKEDVSFEVLNFFVNHIHGRISIVSDESNQVHHCALTGVYGHLEPKYRSTIWNSICSLGGTVDISWIVFGNFNEVLYLSEKWGGRAQLEKQMSEFCEVLARYELREILGMLVLHLHGAIIDGESRIFERLDQFLANFQWCELFPLISVNHIQVAYSNHCLILLNTTGIQVVRSGPKIFKFKAM